MKEFVEKLIDGLEELRVRNFLTIANTGDDKLDCAYEYVGKVLDNTISIINELAEEYKPKTNADKLRNMTNNELANFLDNVFNNIFDGYEFPCEFCTERMNCDICFKDWLDNEVKE